MSEALLEVRGLEVTFRRGWGFGKARETRAVRGVDLSIMPGEACALVGESGSGKSTTARCIAGLQNPTVGTMALYGEPLSGKRNRRQRKAIQMIFQDPYSSLNPRMTVGDALAEVLRVHSLADSAAAARARAAELLDMVGLPPSALEQLPRAFSGGQRQRIGIARALAVDPTLLIADEPVSALDVSIQASILILLKRLQRDLGLSLLFISHDLAVVRQLCDRVSVMADGQLVEEGDVDTVLSSPRQDFTKTLLAATTDLPPLEMDLGQPDMMTVESIGVSDDLGQ